MSPMTLTGEDTGYRLDSSTRIYCTFEHKRFTTFYYRGCSLFICAIILLMFICDLNFYYALSYFFLLLFLLFISCVRYWLALFIVP